MRRPCLALLALIVAFSDFGCGYTLRPPFNREVRTVYVPIFRSNRFRRDLEFQFTQMLQDEIRNRTPYLVVGSPEGADATLEGTITLDDKNLYLENPNNLPRQIQAMLYCVVTYTDNRNREFLTRNTPGNPIPPALVAELSLFSGEIGETSSLGFQKALKKMAQDVVSMMEQPWGEEYRLDPDLPQQDPIDETLDAADASKLKSPRR